MMMWLWEKWYDFRERRSVDLHREIGYREMPQPHIDAKGYACTQYIDALSVQGHTYKVKTLLHPINEFSGRTYTKHRDGKPDVLYREICTTYKCITSSLVRKSPKHEWKKEDDVKYVTKDYKWVEEYDIIKILEG